MIGGGTKGGMWGMGEVCYRKWGEGGRCDIGSRGGWEVDNCISGHILLYTTYFREYSRRVK